MYKIRVLYKDLSVFITTNKSSSQFQKENSILPYHPSQQFRIYARRSCRSWSSWKPAPATTAITQWLLFKKILQTLLLIIRGWNAMQCFPVTKIRFVIQSLRPHYNSSKIDALMQIMDQNCHEFLGFSEFKTRIRKVLHTSLRSARQTSRHSVFLASLTIFVASANLVYVLLYSSPLEFILLSNFPCW